MDCQKKRVLIFSDRFYPISETFIFNQVEGITKNYQTVLLGTTFVNEAIFPIHTGRRKFKYHYGIIDGLVSTFLKYVFGNHDRLSPIAYFRIKRILKQERIDCIYAHFGYMALRILPVAKALGIPLVVVFHGLDASPEFLKRKGYKRNLKNLFDYAKSIIIVSSHMFDALDLNNYSNKVHLIPYGVDVDHFKRSADFALKFRPVVNILHVGRLVEKKGVPDLIDVFLSKISHRYNVHLHVIGDGPEMNKCLDLVELHGGKNAPVTLWGAKPHSFIRDMLITCDILVLNSRVASSGDMEGLPNAMLEGMSMELPVLSTYHAGIPDVISSGVNGLLVKECDNDALANALEILIGDEKLRLSLGRRARCTVIDGYSLQTMNKRISNLIGAACKS